MLLPVRKTFVYYVLVFLNACDILDVEASNKASEGDYMRIKITKLNEKALRVSTPQGTKELAFKNSWQLAQYVYRLTKRKEADKVVVVGL